jgi:2-(3-amino-3-carboxypropyl)histidine synthase
MYDFEIERINREIKKRKAKRVLIQLPEGLKGRFLEIADRLNAECVLSGDPCFGACDIQTYPETDLTIHFGHSKMLESKKVIYVESRSDADISGVVKKAAIGLSGKIGLITTVQHIDELKEAKRLLENAGKKIIIGGQVLGCDVSNAIKVKDKVDWFLFIGSGRFHGLGVAYFTGKQVMLADPYTGKIELIEPESLEKEKYLRIEKAHNARTYGIIVGTKPGQKKMLIAEKIRKRLGRAYLIFMNEITPERLDYLPFDAFIITACPRIVIDDWKNYRKPILLSEEA